MSDFGQWLEDHADELKWSDYYLKVRGLHNLFHHEADKIIQLLSNGEQGEAKEAVGSGSHFDKITQEMVQNLIAWHDIVSALTKTKLM